MCLGDIYILLTFTDVTIHVNITDCHTQYTGVHLMIQLNLTFGIVVLYYLDLNLQIHSSYSVFGLLPNIN